MHRRAHAFKQICHRCELRVFAQSRTYGVTHPATPPRQLRSTSPPAHLQPSLLRQLHATSCLREPPAPADRDRGPPSQEETQTDFSRLDVLANTPSPATAIDMCLPDGFLLGNSLEVTGGTGCFLLNGEALLWRPWEASTGGLINARGQWECDDNAWGALSLVWPKPGTCWMSRCSDSYRCVTTPALSSYSDIER